MMCDCLLIHSHSQESVVLLVVIADQILLPLRPEEIHYPHPILFLQ
jgi:hypothetical protein